MHKRSISIHGHRTSILLEDEFWQELERIANEKKLTLPALIAHIDRQRSRAFETGEEPASLASTLRVYVVRHFIAARATAESDADIL